MTFRAILIVAGTVGALGAARPQALSGQDRAHRDRGRDDRAPVLPVVSLAGQPVAVLPLTLLAPDTLLKRDSLYRASYPDHGAALARADSAIGAALVERAPEVQWALPAELRKIARRSPGMVKDPGGLGHAVLRSPRYRDVPEPLRAELRNLVAVSGGRVVLVPAALGLTRTTDRHIRADLTLVLVDARGGKVLWRGVASGSGDTPDTALDAALAGTLPLDLPTP